MKSVCILTDSTIQFPQPTFAGRNLVRIVPLTVDLSSASSDKAKLTKACDFPFHSKSDFPPKLVIPSEEMLVQWLISPETNQPYDQILAIFTSSYLCSMFSRMQTLAKSWMGKCKIQVIDSLTTSIGLGVVVQAAAESFSRGASLTEVEQIVRGLIPHIYSILCTPNLSYLYHSKIIDVAQAYVGEMLGFLPIYVLEEGKLSPLEKVKNQRQVIDLFQEFMDEFDHLQHIALLQGATANPQVGRLLREHAATNSPKIPFTEHNINLTLSTLFGPQTSGITVVEAL
jgi:DegV family protein with EDD domain